MHDADEIERRRDRTFRRLPALRIAGPERAARFLDEAGLASLFAYRQLNLPCLWLAVCGRRDPVFPHHSHHDPEVALAWNLKDRLPAAGRVFYGKLLRGKPTFISWSLFPAVHRLFGPRTDHHAAFRAGLLSPAAKAILDALHKRRAQDTLSLKLATGLSRPAQRRTFDAAIAELQQTLRICMVEVRYEPFTYVWDLVATRHAARLRGAARLGEVEAAAAVLRHYLATVIAATPNDVAMVVGGRGRAERALQALADDRAVEIGASIGGRAGKWIVWTE